MMKLIKILAVIIAVGVLGWLELGWLGQVDMNNQKTTTDDIIKELPNQLVMIQASMQSDSDQGIDDAAADFQNSFTKLKGIPYAQANYKDMINRLQAYDDGLAEQVALAKGLNSLRQQLATSANYLRKNFGEGKADAKLLDKIKSDFEELKGQLPDTTDEYTKQAVAELKTMIEAIVNAATATAYCINICSIPTIRARVGTLEQAFSGAKDRAEGLNDKLAEYFDNTKLHDEIIKKVTPTKDY